MFLIDIIVLESIDNNENTNVVVTSRNRNPGGISQKRFYDNKYNVLKDRRENLQLNKATKFVTVPNTNCSVAKTSTIFLKTADNSTSFLIQLNSVAHKVTFKNKYDKINKECYKKNCLKGTLSNKKIPHLL